MGFSTYSSDTPSEISIFVNGILYNNINVKFNTSGNYDFFIPAQSQVDLAVIGDAFAFSGAEYAVTFETLAVNSPPTQNSFFYEIGGDSDGIFEAGEILGFSFLISDLDGNPNAASFGLYDTNLNILDINTLNKTNDSNASFSVFEGSFYLDESYIGKTLTIGGSYSDAIFTDNIFFSDQAVTISFENTAPAFGNIISNNAGDWGQILEDTFFDIFIDLSDADGDSINLDILRTKLPGWVNIFHENNLIRLTGVPTNMYIGDNELTLAINDGYETTTKIINIEVIDNNNDPAAITDPFPETNDEDVNHIVKGAKFVFPDEQVLDWGIVTGFSDDALAFDIIQSALGAYEEIIDIKFNYVSPSDANYFSSIEEAHLAGVEIPFLEGTPNNYPGYSTVVPSINGNLYNDPASIDSILWEYFREAIYLKDEHFTYEKTSLEDLQYSLHLAVHEIGHALGLAHPHGGGYETTPDQVTYPVKYNNYETVMSYSNIELSLIGDPQAITLMVLDVEALQYMYGANLNNRYKDNTTFKLTESPSEPHDVLNYGVHVIDPNYFRLNFSQTHSPYYQNIFDPSGNDTLDASTLNAGLYIRASVNSEFTFNTERLDVFFGNDTSGASDNYLSIVGGIENIIGTNYNDHIYSSLDVNFMGLGGDDFFSLASIDFVTGVINERFNFDGGSGDDTIFFGSRYSLDDITSISLNDDTYDFTLNNDDYGELLISLKDVEYFTEDYYNRIDVLSYVDNFIEYPPVFISEPELNAYEGIEYKYVFDAMDGDGDTYFSR